MILSRFPGKPLADLGGKPMIQRVYEQACKVFSTVVVATDDERISRAVRHFGGMAVMTSAAHKSGTDRCAEALHIAEKQLSVTFDAVVNIQGDEPFIQPAQLKLIESCIAGPETQIATLVRPVRDRQELFDPNKPKVVLNKNRGSDLFQPFRHPLPERDRFTATGLIIIISISILVCMPSAGIFLPP